MPSRLRPARLSVIERLQTPQPGRRPASTQNRWPFAVTARKKISALLSRPPAPKDFRAALARASAVGEEDRDRINESEIHIDFMIGSDDVAVTGKSRDGRDVPVLRDRKWQL